MCVYVCMCVCVCVCVCLCVCVCVSVSVCSFPLPLTRSSPPQVFRTYNASHTLQEQLKNTPVDGTVEEKLLAYNRANREVAVLCNHQVCV